MSQPITNQPTSRILKPIGIEINIDDKPRKLLFTINVVDELQEHFDLPIGEILESVFSKTDTKNSYKNFRKIITSLVNEDAEIHNDTAPDKWEPVTEKYVGRCLTLQNSGAVMAAMLQAFTLHLPKNDEDNADPNAQSGQTR